MKQASRCLAPDRLGRPPHCPSHQRESRRAYGPGRARCRGLLQHRAGRVPRMEQASLGATASPLTAWAARPTAQAISGRAAGPTAPAARCRDLSQHLVGSLGGSRG